MPDIPMTLTAEERQYLADLLKQELKQTRIEEHRTRSPLYRENVLQHETTIVNLLNKLGQPPG